MNEDISPTVAKRNRVASGPVGNVEAHQDAIKRKLEKRVRRVFGP